MRWVANAVGLTLVAAINAEAAAVRAVRTIRSDDFTRIIVECSDQVDYQVTRGDGPEPRFAVDFSGAVLAVPERAGQAFESGPAKRTRLVRTQRGVRLIIETRDGASASTFPLLDPFRLVIDVGAHRPDPRAPTEPPPEEGKPAPLAAKALARVKLMIDAGHGGHDPGARGADDLWEKDVVLDVALRLADKARRSGAFEVRMTRTSDVLVPLEERTARANEFGADVFLSVHANAATDQAASGFETYYLNNTGDRATIRLAQMENGVASATGAVARGTDVTFILSDLVQSYKVEESAALAESLQQAGVARVRRLRPELRDIGVKAGPFYVLVGAGMPAVLVEISFLTHPEEGRALGVAAYRDAIADGLLQGLRRFVENRTDAETL